jgi:hypothetical protein
LRSSGRFRQGDLMKHTRPCFSNRGGSLIHEFKQMTANRRPKMLPSVVKGTLVRKTKRIDVPVEEWTNK